MKSKNIKELHKWLNNLLKEKYINKADIKQILNDFDFEAQQQVSVEPKVSVPKASPQNDQTKTFNIIMLKKIEVLKEEIQRETEINNLLYLTRLMNEITSIFRLVNNMFGS